MRRWRALQAPWFNQAKLADVGFDVRTPPDDPAAKNKYRNVLPREAFVVLEYGGQAWEAWIKKQEEALARRNPDFRKSYDPRASATSLTVIDVGRDAETLRRKYPDQARYFVVRGVVRMVHEHRWDPNTRRATQPGFLRGYVREITPDQIHISLPETSIFSRLRTAGGAPRYSVTMRYGRRDEPWVSAIRPM